MTNAIEKIFGGKGARQCLRCATFMNKQPGLWVLQQVQRAGLLGTESGNLRPTGQLITMETHICPACGSIELVNEGGA